jgi:hypothetical protein
MPSGWRSLEQGLPSTCHNGHFFETFAAVYWGEERRDDWDQGRRRDSPPDMQHEVDENNIAKAADIDPRPARKVVPFWRRVPVGWIIVALLIVSWIAFLLMINGISSLLHH